MDFLTVEPDNSNTKDILVITDHFTRYVIAVPTKDQKARTVARCLWDHFLLHYGFPEKLHSDQGPDFESRTIQELCKVVGIRKVKTSPYHPRGNPVEWFNRTLLQMLGTLENDKKAHWKEPCVLGFLPNTDFEESVQHKGHRRPRTKAQSRIENAAEAETVHSHSESESESVHFDVPEESLELTTRVILQGRSTHHSESSLVTRNLPEIVSESPPSVVS